MLKQQIEPYQKFAQNYYVDRDTAHDFRHIERIISRLDFLSQGVATPPNKAVLYFLACFHGLEKSLSDDESFRERVQNFLHDLEWTETEIEKAFQSLERHLNNPQTIQKYEPICNNIALLDTHRPRSAVILGSSSLR